MNTREEIIAALETVAAGLEGFPKPVVFVGGSTIPLYLDNDFKLDVRPTKDVDIVIKAITWLDYSAIEEELRKKGFKEIVGEKVPRCRKAYKGVIVDVMPSEDAFMGFSTRWYKEGIENPEKFNLPSGRTIHIFSLSYILLTKLEATFDRGKDLRWSSDLEDIALILAARKNADRELSEISSTLKRELATSFSSLLKDANLQEAIYGQVPAHLNLARSPEEVFSLIQSVSALK